MHFLGDLLGVERLCGFRSLFDDLYAGIAIKRVGFRLEFLGTEFLDHFFGIWLVARIWTVGHQRAFDARTANRGKFIGGDAIAAHQRRLYALIAHLPDDQSTFRVQAAPIDQVGARLLDFGNQRREILLPGVNAFVENFFHAGFVDCLLHFVGQTFAVSSLVVYDGNFLAFEMLDDVFARDLSLLIITAADAKDVPHLAFSHRRICRGRRDLQDAVFLIDLRRRDGDA